MYNQKLSLEQFVDAIVSKDMHSTIKGGLDISHYMNNPDYDVEIRGSGPYSTEIDGIPWGNNDTW